MIDISQEALEKLDKLSLVSYITIQNSFFGLYMTKQLRRWVCKAEIRIREHNVQFSSAYDELSCTILGVYDQVEDYITSQPDLLQYWDEE